jgi:hypothetical protein
MRDLRHAVPLLVEHLNRAFYIIVVPAIVTTFGWVTFGWGWRLGAAISGAEIVLVVATVVFLARWKNAQKAAAKKTA